jgi:hypothetical protein
MPLLLTEQRLNGHGEVRNDSLQLLLDAAGLRRRDTAHEKRDRAGVHQDVAVRKSEKHDRRETNG